MLWEMITLHIAEPRQSGTAAYLLSALKTGSPWFQSSTCLATTPRAALKWIRVLVLSDLRAGLVQDASRGISRRKPDVHYFKIC